MVVVDEGWKQYTPENSQLVHPSNSPGIVPPEKYHLPTKAPWLWGSKLSNLPDGFSSTTKKPQYEVFLSTTGQSRMMRPVSKSMIIFNNSWMYTPENWHGIQDLVVWVDVFSLNQSWYLQVPAVTFFGGVSFFWATGLLVLVVSSWWKCWRCKRLFSR